MIRKRIVRPIILTIVILTVLTACDFNLGGTGKIKAGKWEENVFTNEWSDVKITLPEGYVYLSKDEMEQIFSQSEEIMINDAGLSEKEIDKMNTKLLYEFLVKFPDQATNISLSYENMSFIGKIISENDYIDILKKDLDKLTQPKYSFIKTEKQEIAGKNYTVAHFSLDSGEAYQSFYIRKIDDVMMLFTATFFENSEEQMDDFINLIEKVK